MRTSRKCSTTAPRCGKPSAFWRPCRSRSAWFAKRTGCCWPECAGRTKRLASTVAFQTGSDRPAARSKRPASFLSVRIELPDAMSAWERYAHDDAPDRLVQLAILHAEFEALHPFLDGNGRLGRMLVPLFLWQSGLIRQPMFYISAYFEARRDAYYDGLLAVSRDDDWTGWCRFFLEAIRTQAEDNLAKAQADPGALRRDEAPGARDDPFAVRDSRSRSGSSSARSSATSDFVASAGHPRADGEALPRSLAEGRSAAGAGGRKRPARSGSGLSCPVEYCRRARGTLMLTDSRHRPLPLTYHRRT